jgi:hypothetical protein
MRLFAHICAYAAVAIVLFVGLFSLLGLRFGNQSELSQLLFESRRSEALRLRSEMVTRNIDIKRTIVADIIAGRLSLREAAVRFQEANCLVENNDPDLLPDYQIPATEEGVYQQVLAWMRSEVSSFPAEQAQLILAPLEKEYEARFGPLEPATASPESHEK